MDDKQIIVGVGGLHKPYHINEEQARRFKEDMDKLGINSIDEMYPYHLMNVYGSMVVRCKVCEKEMKGYPLHSKVTCSDCWGKS